MGEFFGLTKDTMLKMIKQIDVDNDGTICLEEWCNYILKTREKKDKNELEKESNDKQGNILLDLVNETSQVDM